MGFSQWAEFSALVGACVIGTGGLRLISRGLAPATDAVPAIDGATVPTVSAAAPDAVSPARRMSAPLTERAMRVASNERWTRVADELRVRFTPVTIDSLAPLEADEPTGQFAVDAASA